MHVGAVLRGRPCVTAKTLFRLSGAATEDRPYVIYD
jgi:hypothetical protein